MALLAAIAVLAFVQSYQRWLDPIIDTGRDLYIPEQLTQGARLYRDIRYQYPPLGPYALAAITAVIGHSLAAYTIIGLAQSMVMAAALWFIGRRTAGPIAGFVAALLFMALSFCGASTWGANFIFPYSYAATIGMTFIVVALALFVAEHAASALVALFAAAWCKVEYAVAALLIVVVLTVARRLTPRQLAAFVVAFVLSAGIAVVVFPQLVQNVFAEALTKGETARHFFRYVSGLAEWRQNLWTAILAMAGIAAVAWLLRTTKPVIAIPATLVISVLLAGHAFFRAFGLLQYAALAMAVQKRNATLLLLSTFSIATTLRIPLSVSPAWYGFVLIVPIYALIAYVLFGALELGRKAVWWIPLIALLCGRDLGEQRERYSLKQFPIVSSRGVFYDANEDRARGLSHFIRTSRGGTLAVLPEGITLNYLTGRRTPLSFHTFTPVETAAPEVEDSIIGEFAKTPPDEVAIVSRDVTEYGYRGFGIDYDQRLLSYLIQKYALERRLEAQRFQLVLLRHR